jgi:1,4-dihydroxy-2-naphthoate octaprenyltransferase
MATMAQWVEGARPRTLPAAIAPVAVGTGAAAGLDALSWPRALLCLVVALSLQVGVNYANDYSDGVRGTDSNRVGPLRLVGSGAAAPAEVKRAAFLAFAVAALAGLVLVAVSERWWLLLVGAASIAAAWYYTGGSRPYGYRSLGELSVFVFFGLVAVLGTTYVQAGRLSEPAVLGAIGVGLLACALLVVNNLRDAPRDGPAGKRTLAVVLGDQRTRALYAVLLVTPYALVIPMLPYAPGALLALVGLPTVVPTIRRVLHGARGPELVPSLRDTGRAELVYGVLLGIGLAL